MNIKLLLFFVLFSSNVFSDDGIYKQNESIKLAPNSFYTTNFLLFKDGNVTINVTGDKSREFMIFAHPNTDIRFEDDGFTLKCPGFYKHEIKKIATLPFSGDEISIIAEETGHYGIYVANKTKKEIRFKVSFNATKGKFIHTYHK